MPAQLEQALQGRRWQALHGGAVADGAVRAPRQVRVCKEVGVELSERDVENMLSVLAPSSPMGAAAAGGGAAAGAAPAPPREIAISYDKFATMMQQSFRRSYAEGATVFAQEGDGMHSRHDTHA